jgi:flagellar biosynthesis regulator FlbT
MKEVTNAEAIQMMNRCKNEIVMLRAEIDRLAPKAHAYDNISTILRLLPQQSRGMGEDVVWLLENRVRELTAKPEPIE